MTAGEQFLKYKLHHVLLWAIFFGGWFLFRESDFPRTDIAVRSTAIKVTVLASLVYFTNYLLIPKFLYKKRYFLFALLYCCVIILAGFLKIYLILELLQPYYRMELKVFSNLSARIYDNIIPLFLLVSTGAAIKLVKDYILTQKRLAIISREKSETELQYLRSQINPHFVFNSLNAIYFQIDKSNRAARETLLEFADLLRYQLYECNADFIPIEKEIAYLQSYIQLQQKRRNENFDVSFACTPEVSGFGIVPLLLIPFVENAFKHISHFSARPNSICISADRHDGRFNFRVVNTVEQGEKAGEAYHGGGIGLQNVRRRLELLYPERHLLSAAQTGEMYSVHLSLNL